MEVRWMRCATLCEIDARPILFVPCLANVNFNHKTFYYLLHFYTGAETLPERYKFRIRASCAVAGTLNSVGMVLLSTSVATAYYTLHVAIYEDTFQYSRRRQYTEILHYRYTLYFPKPNKNISVPVQFLHIRELRSQFYW